MSLVDAPLVDRDGRALHLGQYPQAMGGLEIQLKGAGPTPFSRMGDGRAVLRSSIREYLCSEAMHGLGIPTSRALALVGASTPVRRESLETAAVVTRVAPSFLRFGHFEHFAHHGKPEQLRALFHDTVQRYFPALTTLDEQEKIVAWVKAVADRTASLMALWQSVGFCHGVLAFTRWLEFFEADCAVFVGIQALEETLLAFATLCQCWQGETDKRQAKQVT